MEYKSPWKACNRTDFIGTCKYITICQVFLVDGDSVVCHYPPPLPSPAVTPNPYIWRSWTPDQEGMVLMVGPPTPPQVSMSMCRHNHARLVQLYPFISLPLRPVCRLTQFTQLLYLCTKRAQGQTTPHNSIDIECILLLM